MVEKSIWDWRNAKPKPLHDVGVKIKYVDKVTSGW